MQRGKDKTSRQSGREVKSKTGRYAERGGKTRQAGSLAER